MSNIFNKNSYGLQRLLAWITDKVGLWRKKERKKQKKTQVLVWSTSEDAVPPMADIVWL